MIDKLSEFESISKSKPLLFKILGVLYFIQVVTANITDLWSINEMGFSYYWQTYKFYSLLWMIDIIQLFISIFYFRESLIAWGLMIIIQSVYAGRFTKNYYLILKNYPGDKLKYLFSYPLSLFFYVNAILIIVLAITPKVTLYLKLKPKTVLVISTISIIIICSLIFGINKVW